MTNLTPSLHTSSKMPLISLCVLNHSKEQGANFPFLVVDGPICLSME